MEIIQTKTLTSYQSEQINSLWNSEYPFKLKDRFPILLEGTTWYYHNIKPAFYWEEWSDLIIHKIHDRVLTHIKKNSEKTK